MVPALREWDELATGGEQPCWAGRCRAQVQQGREGFLKEGPRKLRRTQMYISKN